MPEQVQHQVVIGPDGQISFVWTDDLAELLHEGRAEIRRASHVEPTPTGLWESDLSPVGGPTLGPYTRRADALAAEQEWLNGHLAMIAGAPAATSAAMNQT